MRVAVLGAGISGLSAARMLKDKGHSVTVYEKNDGVGGLARSRNTDGYTYDMHGGHIFNSKHPEVVDWVFSLLPKDKWKFTVRNSKIYFGGRYVSYPFELSLCELDPELAASCCRDFVEAQNGPEPDNFHDWLIWNFGKSIADAYMIPYNEKIWNYPLRDMETNWMQGKMPLPTKEEMKRSLLLKDPTERKMPHSTFYYPIDGGIQSLVDAISEGVDVKLSYKIESIEKTDGGWCINGEDNADAIVSTIPLPVLPSVMKLPDQVSDAISKLKFNSLTTILFDCEKTDISWLYIPSHEYRSHRIVYQSSFSPNITPDKNRGCGAIEIIGDRFEVNDSLYKNGNVLPDELGFNNIIDSEFTDYAYVIHDKNYRKATELIRDYFAEDQSFVLLGRWGTWSYKNMDICIRDAMNVAETLGRK
ncbi:MAG: FAD-dependent oxidoreductase [Clostridiales bacterium]|nr:FAD-dependent oxidoreductase [Clostridiales bacterium]